MDPLVDEYNKTKKGNINSEVFEKSYKETRKFIFRMGIYILGLFCLSLMITAW